MGSLCKVFFLAFSSFVASRLYSLLINTQTALLLVPFPKKNVIRPALDPTR